MDSMALGSFIRSRRDALTPDDVGLRHGSRRRTPGLRREEVAELADMSADYLARLERGAGPRPSEQMVSALARGLRLSVDERDISCCSQDTGPLGAPAPTGTSARD